MAQLQGCASCQFCLPNIQDVGDHRCRAHHVLDIVPEGAAYPTIEWMRTPGGACGPDATMHLIADGMTSSEMPGPM